MSERTEISFDAALMMALRADAQKELDELPENARNYVEYVERAIGCHIGYVSVGAERDSLIIR